MTPHSIEAEQALVARLILDPSQIAVVAGSLSPDDFHIQAYRQLYRSMIRLASEGKAIDVVSLGDDGNEIDVLDLSAGHHAPLESYAAIIKDKAYQRRMVEAGQALVDAAYEGNVDRIMEVASQAADQAAADPLESLGILNLADFKEPPPPLLLDVLSPDGTSVLYGDGGDGKGWVAAKWASQLGVKVAILDFEDHPNEWAYRLDKFGLSDVLYISPAVTLEKWANERSARLLRDRAVRFLIIDSAMYASDVDDPYSPGSTMAYKRARARLGRLPAILLAHTTGGQDKVFGSVFWKNEARIVWRLGKDIITRQRFLECRKANNYSAVEGKRFVIEFNEEAGILNLHPHGQAWSPEAVKEELGW